MKEKMVIIDICGTLYDSNTTFDFLDFCIKSRSYLFFRRLSKTLMWRAFNKACMSLMRSDVTRALAVGHLRGLSEETLKHEADTFYNDVLVHLERKKVLQKVRDYLSEGCRVVLVSATLDFIAKTIAEKIGIQEVYATELNYEEGICMGSIRTDLLSGKYEYLMSMGFKTPFDVTITDDFSDWKLLKESVESMVVSRHEQVARWQQLAVEAKLNYFHIMEV